MEGYWYGTVLKKNVLLSVTVPYVRTCSQFRICKVTIATTIATSTATATGATATTTNTTDNNHTSNTYVKTSTNFIRKTFSEYVCEVSS